MRPLSPVPVCLVLILPLAYARTIFYEADSSQVVFEPAAGWQRDRQEDGTIRTDGLSEASLSFAFAGEQISLFGLSSGSFIVSIDGQEQPSIEESRPPADSSSYSRIYLASRLDQRTNHSLSLTLPPSSGSLLISTIGVSYATASGLVPALLPLSALDAAHTNTNARPSRSAAPTSTPASIVSSEKLDGPNGGAIAGGVVGAFAGLALLVAVIAILARRRNAQRSVQRPSIRGPTAMRQSVASSLLGAFGGGGGGGSNPPGDFSSSPLAGAHLSHPYATSTSTGPNWVNRLARASSWKRKAERLPETRRFYGVGEAAEVTMPSQPPPCVPLPSVPLEATREMEERWRTVGPTLSLDRQLPPPPPPPAAAPPSTVQVYGCAVSDFGQEQDPDHSLSRLADGSDDSYVVIPYPRACVLDGAPSPAWSAAARSLRNPFGSSETNVSVSHGSHESHGSLGSAEGAFIRQAHPIFKESPVRLEPPPQSAGGDTARTAPTAAKPLPVRSSSKRDLVSTHCAGPAGAVSMSLVGEPAGGLARQPSVVRPNAASTGRLLPAPDHDAFALSSISDPSHRRGRPQSSAATVVVVDVEATAADDDGAGHERSSHRRERSGPPRSRSRSRSRSAGEEDRPGFFAARESIPRYSTERDPRRVPAAPGGSAPFGKRDPRQHVEFDDVSG